MVHDVSRREREPRSSLGDRVRELRLTRGMTQTELAGERFSKEYVSQIERGKTRPTGETLAWLAARLGADRSFLETGTSSSERERAESMIARAEAAAESHQHEQTVGTLEELRGAPALAAVPELELRALLAESWSRMYLGEIRRPLGASPLRRGRGGGRPPPAVARPRGPSPLRSGLPPPP